MPVQELIGLTHLPGDGLHYLPTAQETSHGCALFNLEVVLTRQRLPGLLTLWNTVYPHDPLSRAHYALIMSTAVLFAQRFDPAAQDNITAVLDDLVAVGYPELAAQARQLLFP